MFRLISANPTELLNNDTHHRRYNYLSGVLRVFDTRYGIILILSRNETNQTDSSFFTKLQLNIWICPLIDI